MSDDPRAEMLTAFWEYEPYCYPPNSTASAAAAILAFEAAGLVVTLAPDPLPDPLAVAVHRDGVSPLTMIGRSPITPNERTQQHAQSPV